MGNSSQCVQAMKSDAIITRYKDLYICTKCIFSGYRYIEKLNKGVDCILIYVNARFPLTQYGILQRKNKWMYWSLTKELIKGGHQHTQFEFNILHEMVLDFDTPQTVFKRAINKTMTTCYSIFHDFFYEMLLVNMFVDIPFITEL